jgi:hypothetical protein
LRVKRKKKTPFSITHIQTTELEVELSYGTEDWAGKDYRIWRYSEMKKKKTKVLHFKEKTL